MEENDNKSKNLIVRQKGKLQKAPATTPARYRPSDPLEVYIRQISRYKLLDPEEERELAYSLRDTGDLEAAKRLVAHNLRLVVKIALEYKTAWQNVMDLIQEGNLGLMKAVSKYDPDKGTKLSYYASWWIRSYVLKFILDNFRLVKIGTTNEQKRLFYNLLKEKKRLMSEGGKADHKTIAHNLGVSEKAVALMDHRLTGTGMEVSLDTPIGVDKKNTLGDIINDTEQKTAEEVISDKQGLEILQNQLADFMRDLKPRDQDIFKKRLLSEIPPSLQSIADEYGVSRERIRQIEERLIKNLKVYMSDHIR